MPDFNKLYLYRMTHINNMAHVQAYGITHVGSINANPNYLAIGDSSLIKNRNGHSTQNGKIVGDYRPFYFGVHMPMLYVIQKGFNGVNATTAENIVFCITSVQQILNHKLAFVFTDGHAVDLFSSFYNEADINNIDTIIDKKAIESKYWNDENDLDLKRRKEAEFLVENDVPRSAILGFAVFNVAAKNKLLALGINEKQIVIKPDYYFKGIA